MMEYSILLEARDPERNIYRAYHIAAGKDLFGDWIVRARSRNFYLQQQLIVIS